MARNRNHQPDEERPERGVLDERRRLFAAGFLFAAVIAIVFLASWLRTELTPEDPGGALVGQGGSRAENDRPAAVETVQVPDEPRRRPAAAPAPEKREAPREGLEARAEADRGRLARSGGSHTLQLMVACDPDNAHRVIESAGDPVSLYLLPVSLEGKSCYRLCWGSYASRSAAEAARDLPPQLRSAFPDPPARTILEVTR